LVPFEVLPTFNVLNSLTVSLVERVMALLLVPGSHGASQPGGGYILIKEGLYAHQSDRLSGGQPQGVRAANGHPRKCAKLGDSTCNPNLLVLL
jgi:hypothetical protein